MRDYIRQAREKMRLLHTFQDQPGEKEKENHALMRIAIGKDHTPIFEAIVAKDPELATFLMRRHLEQAQGRYFASKDYYPD